MKLLLNLSPARRNVYVSSSEGDDVTEYPPLTLDHDFSGTHLKFGREKFKVVPSSRSDRKLMVFDKNGDSGKLSRRNSVVFTLDGRIYTFIMRDELLPENTPKVPRFVKQSAWLHLAILVLGLTLSFFQPKVPEKIVFELETRIIEKEPPKPPEIEKPKAVVKAAPIAKPKPAPVQPKAIAKKPVKSPRKIVKAAPKAPPVFAKKVVTKPVATTPSPGQIAAAKQAQVAKSLNFLSSTSSNINVGQTFSKNKGSIYGVGKVGTLDAKNATILSNMGAPSMDTNIQTKGSRMVSAGGAVGGNLKGLNDVQGRVSAGEFGGGDLGDVISGEGLSLSGDGAIPQSLIEKILSKHLDKLRYCYEKALLADAGLGGNVLMQWTISTSGHATNVKPVRSGLRSESLHGCISREISKIPFPKPAGGNVMVKFPFNFTSSSI